MIKTLEIRVYFHSWIQAAYHYQSCLLYSIQFFFPRLARHEVQLEQQLGLYIWQVRIIILSLIKMERMKLQCFGVTSEEIRYRRIGNERRIPFAFWPSSQKCLHRTLLIVLYRSKPLLWKKQGLRRSSFIHAKFDNKTKEEFSSYSLLVPPRAHRVASPRAGRKPKKEDHLLLLLLLWPCDLLMQSNRFNYSGSTQLRTGVDVERETFEYNFFYHPAL